MNKSVTKKKKENLKVKKYLVIRLLSHEAEQRVPRPQSYLVLSKKIHWTAKTRTAENSCFSPALEERNTHIHTHTNK